MRVVMLSWEFPPKRVGGIAAALEGLAPAVASQDCIVDVITAGDAGGAPCEAVSSNLTIHRVLVYVETHDFFDWIHRLNDSMYAPAAEVIKNARAAGEDVILHVHDWLTMFVGLRLKDDFGLRLVTTIHATEYGRNHGIHTDTQHQIHSWECELIQRSDSVIVCSEAMRHEIVQHLGAHWHRISVIPNGVDGTKLDAHFSPNERDAFRLRFAGPNEKIVFFIGRMVGEKGAHLLVEAVGKLHPSLPIKLVISGGGARTHLEQRAQALGIWDSVYFTGRISDEDRDGLYAVADVAVYPSLYEPFGIVALEAMAAGVPVVVSEAGGLREVVEHDVTGTTTYAGDVNSLAWGIDRVLRDDVRAAKLAERAKEVVRTKFSWNPISRATVEVYQNVLNA